jgi:hypothetical protein
MTEDKKTGLFSFFRNRSEHRILQLSPIAHLPTIFPKGELVAFNVGPDGCVYLVAALAELDYRTVEPGWAIFPKTVPDQTQKYRVVGLSGGRSILDVVIEQERFNIHHVQPLGDEILLVCARSHFRGPKDFDENGRIYTRDGRFVRSILLGDGIQSVQTTSDKVVWTSFFDEGVFGNYGWENPVGASGLVAWDAAGKRLFEFQPIEGLDSITDCYALNVESGEDVWFYYYTEFVLIQLNGHKISKYWKIPISGSDAFAVSDGLVLFRGGYEERDSYYLFSIRNNGKVKKVSDFELQDHDGRRLVAENVVGRSDQLHFISGEYLYCLEVQSVLQDFPRLRKRQ